MTKPQRPSGRTNLASCIVATIFLIFLIIVVLIVYFTVFKPQDPKISVSAIQLPSFAVSNGSVNFTFSQYSSVRNPNRAVFSHYDSSLQLLYSGTQVGFMFIPAGKIDSGRTIFMAASFSVQSFPLSTPASTFGPPLAADGLNGPRIGPTLEIESRMEMAGRKKPHSGHRKREKASKKKAEARKHAEEEAFRVNGGLGGYGYCRPLDNGYGYNYPPSYYYQYPYQFYGRQGGHYPHYDEYVSRAPLSYRDGFNHYGCLHFGDTDPYLCYQSFYETPIMPFPQAPPPPPKLHPFSTPETICSIM
ncbi:Late embryogenesis abundant protein [Senna tora]|uniref:Late embryogenesis abundant protein n=1 Tax=Senna tora TaxID=362788 RepID=A0A834TXG5_9FABA|nr:Late embryogenesis abundant protein [Senna tora]